MGATTVQFEVEETMEANGRAYVLARLLDAGARFTLADLSSLDGWSTFTWPALRDR
jgi:hypothetical protein